MDKKLEDFLDYVAQFRNKKGNQLDYSNATIPNRIIPIRGLDLSVDLNGLFREYNIPFRTIHVEKAYQTSDPTISKSAEIKMAYDYNNIGNVHNYKLLKVNDTFEFSQSISKFSLGWDVQADTSVDIACMLDVNYKSGTVSSSGTTQQVQIVGTVPTNEQRNSIASGGDIKIVYPENPASIPENENRNFIWFKNIGPSPVWVSFGTLTYPPYDSFGAFNFGTNGYMLNPGDERIYSGSNLEVFFTQDMVSDFSYTWNTIFNYTPSETYIAYAEAYGP